jgi:hypothetical protein
MYPKQDNSTHKNRQIKDVKVMARGWYQNRKDQPKFLSVEEIAAACCISAIKVRKCIAGTKISAGFNHDDMVDSAAAMNFLVENGMSIPTSLLPANTKKILFITDDDSECAPQAVIMDAICRVFADCHNILARTSTPGRHADMSILTHVPDAVIIFLTQYNKSMANTFDLLAGIHGKVVLFVDDETLSAIQEHRVSLPADRIFNTRLPIEQLATKLIDIFSS